MTTESAARAPYPLWPSTDSAAGVGIRPKPRIMVVGDVLLDRWWHGSSTRQCREAPAPVIDLQRRDDAPGGAGNTAGNAAALGASVALFGVVGQDADGARLARLLRAEGVDCAGLLRLATSTTSKQRIVLSDEVIARLDERAPAPAAEHSAQLAALLPAALRESDVVLVCDYGLGTLEGPVAQVLTSRLATRGTDGPLVIVDAHDPTRWRDLHPDVSTPNFAEASLAVGGLPELQRVEAVRRARDMLLERTGACCVVVTLDREGSLALAGLGFDLGVDAVSASPWADDEHRTFAVPTDERQAAGAGDTFAAGLAVALAHGLPARLALELAQTAADVVVATPGTAMCSASALRARWALRGTVETVDRRRTA